MVAQVNPMGKPHMRDDEPREYIRLALVPSCAVDDAAMTPDLLSYLVAFCSYASKRNDGRCWVAQAKVARRMGVTRQAVSKAALRLAELGYMVVQGEWSGSTIEGKPGKQLTNTYWINLNMTVPPERDRSGQPRKRAGIGGAQKRAKSAPASPDPATPAVAPPATPAVAPPATPAVAPPATPAVAQNTESEYGEGTRRGKHAPANESPTFNQWILAPEHAGLRMRPMREKIVAYEDYCRANGLEVRR